MQWLEQNKEWFLSGAGIFIAASIVSFASVLFTLWLKSRSEQKKTKKLRINSGITKFSAPSANDNNDISPEDIKVSYKGIEYENLCFYSAQITNIGLPAIENQRLHIIIPAEAQIIKVFENKSLESIQLKKDEIENSEKKEIVYEFTRLEVNDVCTMSYLLDLEDVASVNCEPRGVDNIEYSHEEDINKSEIDVLVIAIASFVFADMVPIIGNLFQALIIIAASPVVIEIIKKYLKSKCSKDSVLNIAGGIYVDADGELYINQAAK